MFTGRQLNRVEAWMKAGRPVIEATLCGCCGFFHITVGREMDPTRYSSDQLDEMFGLNGWIDKPFSVLPKEG